MLSSSNIATNASSSQRELVALLRILIPFWFKFWAKYASLHFFFYIYIYFVERKEQKKQKKKKKSKKKKKKEKKRLVVHNIFEAPGKGRHKRLA